MYVFYIQSNELKPVYSTCRYLVGNGTLFFYQASPEP